MDSWGKYSIFIYISKEKYFVVTFSLIVYVVSDNEDFEVTMPTSAKAVADVNKWEGEDEEDDVKVRSLEILLFTSLK